MSEFRFAGVENGEVGFCILYLVSCLIHLVWFGVGVCLFSRREGLRRGLFLWDGLEVGDNYVCLMFMSWVCL